jgi:hypothetical protein
MNVWEKIVKANTYILCVAAVLCGLGHWLGSFVFMYTSTIGVIDSRKHKSFDGTLINLAFLLLNLFFSTQTICGLF